MLKIRACEHRKAFMSDLLVFNVDDHTLVIRSSGTISPVGAGGRGDRGEGAGE